MQCTFQDYSGKEKKKKKKRPKKKEKAEKRKMAPAAPTIAANVPALSFWFPDRPWMTPQISIRGS